jgi:hypothetical protein
VCTALALAERGIAVDLYERDDTLLSRASYWNEGKIHLGFVYAQDRSRRSAVTMLEGALSFRRLLTRWMTSAAFDAAVSDPFIYAVHRDTMIPVDALEDHFHAIDRVFSALAAGRRPHYVASTEPALWRRHEPAETRALFDADAVVASYQTQERSVDPFCVAAALRKAVAGSTVTALTGTTVRGVHRAERRSFDVASTQDGTPVRETYTAVVNALWENRLGIDRTVGHVNRRPILHRLKVGLHSRASLALKIPSVTFVSGAFGDSVQFQRRAYVSWYPAGLLVTSRELVPPPFDADVFTRAPDAVAVETLRGLARLFVGAPAGLAATSGQWNVGGGYISAWARTGIDHPGSRLHQRFDVGVTSNEGYHSIDTGKYTLGPHFADVASQRIVPARMVRGPLKGCGADAH